VVVFIDDILTTGTHFKVSKEIFLQNDSQIEK
jgi:predicted amidophosphoribosyltransferase